MFFAVNRLDAQKFAALDFTTNFGIEPQNRKLFTEFLTNGGTYQNAMDNLFA